MHIFPHSNLESIGLLAQKLWSKNSNFGQRNFLAITFKPSVRLIPNFECEQNMHVSQLVCKISFALGSIARDFILQVKIWRGKLKTSGLHGIGNKPGLHATTIYLIAIKPRLSRRNLNLAFTIKRYHGRMLVTQGQTSSHTRKSTVLLLKYETNKMPKSILIKKLHHSGTQ